MKLFAKDLLQEELEEKQSCIEPPIFDISQRIEPIKDAIQELDSLNIRLQLKDISIRTHEKEINRLLTEIDGINYKLNCSNCKHDISLEELRKLSDEAALNYFERCSSCSNYYQSKFEGK